MLAHGIQRPGPTAKNSRSSDRKRWCASGGSGADVSSAIPGVASHLREKERYFLTVIQSRRPGLETLSRRHRPARHLPPSSGQISKFA
ncbi:hypothetical protein BZL30_5639 [Mycobacterium kansasii]|uniref:Uncharacterized protein n=1 Tax=Mycobacterium kansasii TaxID=1768 RepID=A0A1V3WYK9_MYCKA|nr:hypothetical protein BZL30_5639 [Mycobacterium kansasii]